MDIVNYIDTIRDELEGADSYIRKAIVCKSEHPTWASMYAKMSEAELVHAVDNVKIFEDDFKSQDADVQDVLSGVHDSVISMYAEQSSRIKMMHQIYSDK